MVARLLRLSILVALIPLWASLQPALAQELKVVDDVADGTVLEASFEWPFPLRQAIDSLGVSSLTARDVASVSNQMASISEVVELTHMAEPRLQIVSSEYDEVRISLEGDVEEMEFLREYLGVNPAFATGTGLQRRSPVTTIVFPSVTYDFDTQTLRRYRRIVARVQQPAAPASDGRFSRAAAATNPHVEVTRSVLADGIVFKFPIEEEGVYRIDGALLRQWLTAAGQSPSSIDASSIRLYGNGGAPVPAVAGDPRPADLVENPIVVNDGGDGSFDANDAIIFYAKGPNGWNYNADTGRWEHYVNPFDNRNYYFLKIGSGEGRRIQQVAAAGGSATTLSRVTGRHYVQPDQIMWGPKSGGGLTWVSTTIQSSGELRILNNASLPGLAAGTIRYDMHAAAGSNRANALLIREASAEIARIPTRPVPGSTDAPVALDAYGAFEQNRAGAAPINLTMRIESSVGNPSAALHWLRMEYPQDLRAREGYLRFATPGGESGVFEFQMSGFASTPTVWDVTEPGTIRRLPVESSGSGHSVRVFVEDSRRPREIIAFEGSAVRAVTDANATAERVEPQNLHGISGHPEFVIVTAEPFRAAAERLADHRRSEGMTVEVVDIQKIFNEFSGGLQDMRAVRDYFKFLYDRSPGDPVLRYALLFGDTHFDYRNIRGDNALTNWIPSYQTEDSFNPEYSYTSDDYFALLDDEEGLWPYPGRTTTRPPGGIEERMDIGIGRLPVQTAAEADQMVDKIIRYENVETFGGWRTRYTFLADDHLHGISGSRQEQDIHTQNSDVVAELIEQTFPQVNIRKIYGQSYQREYIGGSWRLPGVNRDLVSTLNNGTLVLNYSGHGNEDFLMQENVFGRSDLARLTNAESPSIFVTATCDFGRYDMPDRQSTAEELLLMAEGGSIALFTTVRIVWTSASLETLNVGLNRALNREMFRPDETGQPRRLGDILYRTKNTRAGLQGNSHKFNLLGDPTMRIGLPTRQVAIESVNEIALSDSLAALSALDRITVRGSVLASPGGVDASYNGLVDLTVFDAARDVPIEVSYYYQPYYTVREDLIWRGTAHVTGGEFEAEFVVPRDISYRNEPGRISAYAYNSDEHAVGYTQRVVVGGTAANPTDDADGPKVEIFLNDTTFVDGGVVAPNPRLMVRLSDESGINTVGSGVGHELLLIYNDNEQDVVDLSSHYESEAGSYQRGTIEYQIDRDLKPGLNSISVRAWDVVNNSTTERIEFYVGETGDLALKNVFNYPNPTSGRTRFVFEHNQPTGTPANVQVRVYTINGRPVRTIDGAEALPSGVLSTGVVQIPWDGLDEDQGRLATGVYLYRLRVEVDQPDGARQVSEHVDRIAIIR